jgi:hypothetical protein
MTLSDYRPGQLVIYSNDKDQPLFLALVFYVGALKGGITKGVHMKRLIILDRSYDRDLASRCWVTENGVSNLKIVGKK